jgi:hypothetical protein
MRREMSVVLAGLLMLALSAASPSVAEETGPGAPSWTAAAVKALEDELVATYGEAQRDRARRGLEQVASFWRASDGDWAAFEAFVRRHFAGDQATLDTVFARFERLLEKLDGHMLEIMLAFRWQSDLDLGPILPFDEVFAGYNPSAHVTDDLFDNKLAFVVLLNFPITTLEQRLTEGREWTRRQWAEARLADRFSKRIPAEVQLEVARSGARAGQYIAQYNIWMHHLVADGKRVFPPKLRLLSHWNLRDELKASYADPETGLQKQRTIQKVMERIVDQTIPEVVIDSPHVDWNPFTNEVAAAEVQDSDGPVPEGLEISSTREPDTRYAVILGNFRAQRKVDPWSPTAPTLIARRFDEDREIPEERVEAMFETVLSSPLLEKVARLIESRVGRPLEPFDIWYSGFRPRGAYTEAELDATVKKRYPTSEAYEKDMPNLLEGLGFTKARAAGLSGAIAVDSARGSGHAWGAAMREAKSRLRTRVGPDGMDYKGFNIAVHEMGHNVEQTISLREIDHTLLTGVPNTAFTEALAFVFQARDLELLGLAAPSAESRSLQALDDFWSAAEIAAVALVDMGVWHWMYEHPEATSAELREATMTIARGVWNTYYAPIIGEKDSVLLGIYSHMVARNLYLPDYPIGSLIAVQLEEQMVKTGDLGSEFTRMAVFGRVVPDLWMENATGSPVGPDALLVAAATALQQIGE